jgi:mRNA interferase RelE/StbE
MKVVLDKQPEKYLARQSKPLLNRLLAAIENLSHEPPEGDIKRLKGQDRIWRLRVGSYRRLYITEQTCIRVVKIAPRGDIYKE